MAGAGLGNGLGAGLTLDEPATIVELTVADLAFAPALAVVAGIAALAVAVRRPWMAWLAVAFIVVSLYLGALLRLPPWLLDASPVGQTTAPSDYPVVAMVAMCVLAAAFTALAGWLSPGGCTVAAPRCEPELLAQTVGSEVIGIVIVGALLAEQPARRA